MQLERDLYTAITQVRRERLPAVLVTVVESVGSAPQQPGARLLVASDGQVVGTVGGGTFEHRVLDEARALLAEARRERKPLTRLWRANLTALGMCCGGTMSVFLETVALPARLVILGAGHIARPLCELASRAGFEVTVVDSRPDWATAERFPDARDVIGDDPEAAVSELALDAETAVVVVTHEHRLDQALVKALVGREAGFFGLVGSIAKRNKFLLRLRAQGIAEEDLTRLRSPLGIEIGAQSPEEIAVSILAELVAWRRGAPIGEGRPLRAKHRPERLSEEPA